MIPYRRLTPLKSNKVALQHLVSYREFSSLTSVIHSCFPTRSLLDALFLDSALTLILGQPEKKPFHIPVAVGLLDKHGKEIPLQMPTDATSTNKGTHRVLEMKQQKEQYVFTGMNVTIQF